MEEQQPPPTRLDYARPVPPRQTGDISGPAKIATFVGGIFIGPVLLGMMIAFLSILTDGVFKDGGAGAIVAAVLYVALIAFLSYKRETRWFGVGMICGPVIAFFALYVICGGGFN